MGALGFIETRGLLTAIESADVMLKTAQVSLVEKTYVGGGLVSITVTGDVAAVSAAVDAASQAVRQINEQLLVSKHVIPRPHEELTSMINGNKPSEQEEIQVVELETKETAPQALRENDEEKKQEDLDRKTTEIEQVEGKVDVESPPKEETPLKETVKEEKQLDLEIDLEKVNKQTIDQIMIENGLEEGLHILSKLKVTKLRKLAREFKELGIAGRAISKASKKILLTEFKNYYENESRIKDD